MIVYAVKVWDNGDKHWHLNGKFHREDGPAIEMANGNKCWYLNGKRHREDGPAIEWSNGDKHWYLNDKYLSHSEWKQEVGKLNQPTCNGKVVEIEGKKYRLTIVEDQTMNNHDARLGELVENIWQSFIEDWVESDCQEPEFVNDYLNETLWEFIDKLNLDLAFYILASNPAGLDWGFFKDMYLDCSDWDGPYAVKNTALQLIWDNHLIPRAEAFKLKLLENLKPSEKTKSDKQIWKGTLDPEKIKWIAQIPPEDRKDNRSGPYTRHPC